MDRYCRYQSHPLHRTSSELNKTLNTNYSTNQEIFTISWEYIYHQSRDLYSVTIRIVHLNCGINSSVESVLVCLCRTERLVEVLTNLVITIHLCGKSTLRWSLISTMIIWERELILFVTNQMFLSNPSPVEHCSHTVVFKRALVCPSAIHNSKFKIQGQNLIYMNMKCSFLTLHLWAIASSSSSQTSSLISAAAGCPDSSPLATLSRARSRSRLRSQLILRLMTRSGSRWWSGCGSRSRSGSR